MRVLTGNLGEKLVRLLKDESVPKVDIATACGEGRYQQSRTLTPKPLRPRDRREHLSFLNLPR